MKKKEIVDSLGNVSGSLQSLKNQFGSLIKEVEIAIDLLEDSISDTLNNLQDIPATIPVPPAVPEPATSFYVSVDGKMRDPYGNQFIPRVIESMYGPDASANTRQWVAVNKLLGANAIGPLPQRSVPVAEYKDLLDETYAAGLVMFFNVDHAGGLAKLTQPDVVELLNKYNNVILECQIELGSGMSESQWVSEANAFVKRIRDAGLVKQIIKVGSPDGGRNPAYAIKRGKEVLAADPSHNLCFTWQAYWSTRTGWYQGLVGVQSGIEGTKQCVAKIASSGLCFVVGLDAVDDVGDTGSEILMDELHKYDIGWLWWVLDNGNDPNALVTNRLNERSTTARGKMVCFEHPQSMSKTSKMAQFKKPIGS